ncbi:hypothetical protein GQ43DRAFT_490226 [Delitschia confertaspora ATCC 74209]|uniref:Uncharacterized protein n=1 Tax=Delitschia confertaspora ATCC 74209 TaxID=1513339 RepID=A0A9P4JVA9_9PLEO|nr:hypothetical protein GQ43DRAFT_490226 [Delitschia confertaspora ATCC 74209]
MSYKTIFKRWKSPLWALLLLLILTNLATSLYTLPLNRVIEMRLCLEHYQATEPSAIPLDGLIPEKLCKVDEVQKQLAWLQGIMETTLVVCDFIVTIPFSFLAKRPGGVKLVLWANLVPRIFMSIWAVLVGNYERLFPTKTIIAGPFLAVLGGECVFSSTIFTLTAALTNEYVQRSISYVVAFVGPSLASFTMGLDLWLPFWLNIGLLLLAVPTINLLPGSNTSSTFAIIREAEDTAETGPLLTEQSSTPNKYSNAFEAQDSVIRTCINVIHKFTSLVMGRRNFQIMLVSFLLTALASSDTKLLVQYISKRYEWTFAEATSDTDMTQAGYLLSTKALVNVTLLTVIVPRIIKASSTSKTVHNSEVRLNFLGAEGSIAVSILGVLCVAMSSKFWMLIMSLIIYALGSALPVFTMSLVRSPLIVLADSETYAQDFSIVMLTKTFGSLLGAPLMTVLWVQAIKVGGAGLGLPYFVSASLYFVAAVIVAQLTF